MFKIVDKMLNQELKESMNIFLGVIKMEWKQINSCRYYVGSFLSHRLRHRKQL